MNLIKQFLIYSIVVFVAIFMNYKIDLIVPIAIYGMLILFLALNMNLVKTDEVSELSTFLQKNLSLFLIPSAVAILNVLPDLGKVLVQVTFTVLVSTSVCIVVTGKLVELVKGRLDVK